MHESKSHSVPPSVSREIFRREYYPKQVEQLLQRAQKWGVALSEEQSKELENQGIAGLGIFKQASLEGRYILTYFLLRMLNKKEKELLYIGKPQALIEKISSYDLIANRPLFSEEANTEKDFTVNLEEEQAWFDFLNKGLILAKEKYPILNPENN